MKQPWLGKEGRIHEFLCDGWLERHFVFPILQDGITQFYIKCPCCAFWRGISAGSLIGGVVTSVIWGIVWIVN